MPPTIRGSLQGLHGVRSAPLQRIARLMSLDLHGQEAVELLPQCGRGLQVRV